MPSPRASGVSIRHDGRSVALKWHRLRRRSGDPLFGVEVLQAGLRLGASMEIDVRVTADSDFVVLHDDVLDDETNGRGRAADHSRATLAALCYADVAASGTKRHNRPLLFLDDLVALLPNAHPHAVLQFDMKDEFTAIGSRGVDRLANCLKGHDLPLIISGDCGDLIFALKESVPGMRCGIEPSFRLIELFRNGNADGAVAQLSHELAGPTEPEMVYLNWELILHALTQGIDLVAICRDEGKKVDAWTFTLADPITGFSDAEWRDFSRLLSVGVDQITTDEAIATEAAYIARTASG